MRYFLKIEDCDERGNALNAALSVIAQGEYADGALSLDYLFDGARYSLKVEEGCVRHTRCGDIQMSLEFRLGELTCGCLKSGGMSGNLNIYTHELKIILTSKGCSARLVFSDGVEGGEKLVKSITAYPVK